MLHPQWSSWSFSEIIDVIFIDLRAELQQRNRHVVLKSMLLSIFLFPDLLLFFLQLQYYKHLI